MRRVDLKGKKFGKLEAISFHEIGTGGRSKWLCKCSCGNDKIVFADNLLRGATKSCGCSWRIKGKKHHLFSGIEEISGAYLHRARQGAISRNLEYSVTNDYLWEIYTNQGKKCALSGLPIDFQPSTNIKRGGKKQTASLDRIDSSKGYIKGNIQWVHKDINKIKQDLKEDYFIELCKAIVQNVGNDKY